MTQIARLREIMWMLVLRDLRTCTERWYETGWLRVWQRPDHRRIDEAEVKRAREGAPREKFVLIEEMIAAAKG